ncbi:MAG: DUF427 domain-containing protein [Bacteroidota bacterium]
MNKKRIKPGPGQESVWDYPRPPKLEKFAGHIRIMIGDDILVDTNGAYRVLETSHPPVYYLPPEDIIMNLLAPNSGSSFCEFKGRAAYYDLQWEGKNVPQVAWYYPSPSQAFLPIKGYLAFYAHKVSACYVNDEQVQAQEGDFYGGWITSWIVGPFKGAQGTWGW